MNEFNFTSVAKVEDELGNEAQVLKVVLDGNTLFVAKSTGNRHYDEIMRQVADGTLTIQDAD